jgi:small subunit ribosomal protein S17
MSSGSRKEKTGMVISDKMDKTVVVQIDRMIQHPMYKKYIRRRSRLKAHDDQNRCKIGDKVRISEARPLSKSKSWRVTEILTDATKKKKQK